MKSHRLLIAASASALAIGVLSTVPAHAELESAPDGHAVYYADRNVAWMVNANLAATSTFGVSGILAASGHAAVDPKAIIQATKDYIVKETEVKDPLVTVDKVVDGYARVQVSSKSGAASDAVAFLKLKAGKWKVLTVGSQFGFDELRKLKIPTSLQCCATDE